MAFASLYAGARHLLANTPVGKEIFLLPLNKAIQKHICLMNKYNGYTCPTWIDTLKEMGIQISMDGRGRCLDNHWIERFWHTLKTEYVYLHPHTSVADMRSGIAWYINYYNNERGHSQLKDMPPRQYYLQAKPYAA